MVQWKTKYECKNGYWNFIPKNFEELNNELWKVWKQLQKNGISAYDNSPSDNLGVGFRKDFIEFADFCNLSGLVLDVGVGPQKIPTHIEYNKNKDVEYIGIDPIAGQQPRDFTFIQGLAEYLPFKDQLFDHVIFVTSLDHFIDPVIALHEAKRVLKETGTICIWIGEKEKNTPKPSNSPDWYKKLKIPKGAVDPFHYRRISVAVFKTILSMSNLRIVDEQINIIDPWRKNCFYRLIKSTK